MNRYHDLIDRIDGYMIGTLTVDNSIVAIQSKDGEMHTLEDGQTFDVLNGDQYEGYSVADALSLLDSAGWSLLAGLYARCKR